MRASDPSQVNVNWQPVLRCEPWNTTAHTPLGKAGWRTRLSTTWTTARSPGGSSPASYHAARARQSRARARSAGLPAKRNAAAAGDASAIGTCAFERRAASAAMGRSGAPSGKGGSVAVPGATAEGAEMPGCRRAAGRPNGKRAVTRIATARAAAMTIRQASGDATRRPVKCARRIIGHTLATPIRACARSGTAADPLAARALETALRRDAQMAVQQPFRAHGDGHVLLRPVGPGIFADRLV